MQKAAMARDFGWDAAAREYAAIYESHPRRRIQSDHA
jgi:glycogen synthase